MCIFVRFSCKLIYYLYLYKHIQRLLRLSCAMCYFQLLNFRLLFLFCCQLTSLQWGRWVISESTWYLDCKLVVLLTDKFIHISPCIIPCPKPAVLLCLTRNYLAHLWECTFCPFSLTLWASINWLTPPVLLCRELQKSILHKPTMFVFHGGGRKDAIWAKECALRSS